MGILSWIILGLLAGVLAKWIMQGKQSGGIVMTMLLGIVGAFVGGYVGSLLGLGGTGEFDLRTLGLAVAGALILLWLFRKLRGG